MKLFYSLQWEKGLGSRPAIIRLRFHLAVKPTHCCVQFFAQQPTGWIWPLDHGGVGLTGDGVGASVRHFKGPGAGVTMQLLLVRFMSLAHARPKMENWHRGYNVLTARLAICPPLR